MRTFLLAAALMLVADTPRAQPAATGSIKVHVEPVQGNSVIPIQKVDGHVWIWLIDKTHPAPANPKLPSQEIDQIDTTFEPHVLVVPKGTRVDFPNKDNQPHNVFSPVPFFDLGRYNPTKKPPFPFHVFKASTPKWTDIEIYCDIHKCMWARLKVVDVADPGDIQKLDKSPDYEFKNLAPGTYEVWAWAAGSQEVSSHDLVVKDKQVVAPTLKVNIVAPNTAHKNKDGVEYPPSQYSGRCGPTQQ